MGPVLYLLKKVFSSPNSRNLVSLALTLLILVFIPLTVFQVINSRDDRGQAAVEIDKSRQYAMPIMVLSYFPTKDGVNIDSSITGFSMTINQARTKVNNVTARTMQAMELGSTYHGYKDATAQPVLDYSILNQREFLETLPLGLPLQPGIYRPDYRTILNNLNICDYVNNQGLKEVWLYGWHYGPIEPVESDMSSPTGDVSNSERTDDLPICNKTYILYNFNYGRPEDSGTHNFGHQIEAMMMHIDKTTWDTFTGPWETYGDNDGSGANFHRCGWTHNPPNVGLGQEYIYNSTRSVWTDCEDWKPDGSGAKTYINCQRWKCDQTEFHIWRWQNMPGRNNPVQGLTNWWDFFADWDGALARQEKLLYNTVPPAVPTGLTATSVYSNQVELTWTPSNSGVVDFYQVSRDDVILGTVGSNKFSDFTVSPNITYSYKVEAFNELGIGSGTSLPLSVTTNIFLPPDLSRPVLDSYTTKIGGSSPTYTWSHTVGPYLGRKSALFVVVAMRKVGSVSVSGIKYADTPLTKVGSTDQGGVRTEIWRLLSPDVGTNNVQVDFSASVTGSVMGATSWYGVDPVTPTSTFAGTTGFGLSPSVNALTSSNQVVIDVLSMPNLSSDSVVPATGQTQYLNHWSLGDTRGAAGYKNSTSPVTTMGWTGKYEAFSLSAVGINVGQINTIGKLGDINQDGFVNSGDLAIIISTWGSTSDLRADINKDGRIASADLAVVISRWGS